MNNFFQTQLGTLMVVGTITCLLTFLLTAIGFWLKSLYRRMEKQEDAHNFLERNLPVDYVRREDFVHWTIKIDKKVSDIDAKLDKKIDDLTTLIQNALNRG